MKAYRQGGKVMSHNKLKSMVGMHAAGAAPAMPAEDTAYAKLGKRGKAKPAFAAGGPVMPDDQPPAARLDRAGRGRPGATVNVIVAPGPKEPPQPPMPAGPMPTPPPMMPPPAAGGAPPPGPMPPPMAANRGGRMGFKRGGAAKSWISGAIKNPGALHRDLGVPQGEKIPAGKLAAATKSDNPTVRKRANLAKTLKGLG
jgi:hypothetical protein